jgi:hypothetical protein
MSQASDLIDKGFEVFRGQALTDSIDILRYTISDVGRPDLGIAPTRVLVAGLSGIEAVVNQVSERMVLAGQGKIELTDLQFTLRVEVKETDHILFPSGDSSQQKEYMIVQTQQWEPGVSLCVCVGRAV